MTTAQGGGKVVSLTHCTVLCHLLCSCVMGFFFLTSFMSECCMTEFVDLQNDMWYVCMYVIVDGRSCMKKHYLE